MDKEIFLIIYNTCGHTTILLLYFRQGSTGTLRFISEENYTWCKKKIDKSSLSSLFSLTVPALSSNLHKYTNCKSVLELVVDKKNVQIWENLLV